MKTTLNLLLAGIVSVFYCSIGNAQISYSNSLAGATLIYSNGFDGSGTVNITNTPADYEAGILGGKSNTNWVDALGANNTNALYANGQVGTAQGDAWLLPFAPQAGYVYTINAAVNFAGNPGTWMGAGFCNYFGIIGGSNDRFNTGGVDFGILTEGTRNVQSFAGPGAATQFGNSNSIWTPATGVHTLTQILDTTGTKWIIACFVDGRQAGTNYPYPTTNPTILGVGLTQNVGVGTNAFTWNSFSLSANPIVITKQPVSANVAAGIAFTNTVVVAATAPAYQWYRDGLPLPLAGQTNIVNGATSASLILNPVEPSDTSTNYYVIITNSSGSVTSAPASLAVYSAPTISSAYPVAYSNQVTLYGGVTVGGTNYAGSTPTFSVSVIGETPLYFQWRTNGVAVPGATNTSFTFTNCQLTGPTSFACVVTNFGGAATNTWLVSYVPAPTAPFPQAVLAFNASGFWRLNEAPDNGSGDDGVIAIDYASGNNGIYSNAYLANPGYTGTDPSESSVVFNAVGTPSDVFGIQGLDFSAPLNTSAAFTVQGWVKGPGTQQNGAGIIGKSYSGAEQFVLEVNNNKYEFLVRDAGGNPYSVTAASGPDGNWHFLVGVCDEVNGAVSLYVDGSLAGSVPIAAGSGLLSSPNPITIGATSSSATLSDDLQFSGYLSDLAAFNHALSISQVVEEYSTVVSVPPYFTQTPPTHVTANAGDSLTLSATAFGTTPIGYYWTDVNAGTNVEGGATNGLPLNAVLTVTNIPGSWNGDQLELTVTNAAGSTNLYVSLTVYTNLTIVNDLPPSLALLSGSSYTYSIGVVGPPPYSYQWYHAGSPVANQTNSTFTITAGSGSTTYYVVIADNFGAVTSLVSTVTGIAQLTNAYAAGILQLNPSGYWPMHEMEAPAPGDIETNYGTLGPLGTAYYSDWAADYGAYTRQVPGAIAGSDTALHFNYNVGNLGNGAGTWTNEIYIPHTSPLSTLNPPFSVECWLYNTNTSAGQLNQSVWGQHGWEGFNSGYAGSGTGSSTISGMQLAYSTTGITVYGYFAGAQNPITSASVPINSWHQVIVTCDASTNFTIYVDGVSAATAAGVGKYTPDYWTPLAIGGTRGGTRSAIITVDEFAVYTNVISAGDITAHYNDASVSDSAYFHDVTNDNPVIYLRMDAPPYTPSGSGSWPELINYGTVGNAGTYSPGTMPGTAPGPASNGVTYAGLSGTNVAALSGVSSFADAGYASAYNPTGSNANFTLAAMFRGNPCDNRVQSILSHGANSWQLNVTTNGHVVFNAGNGNAVTRGTGQNPGDMSTVGVYNDGNWHQVVAVNSTNLVSIYVDGVLDTTGTPAGTTPTSVILGNSGDVMIGSDPANTNNPVGVGRQFAGQVCEVAFFNQAMSSTQVQGLYNLAINGNTVVINPNPTNIVFSVSGNQLTLSWPSDHTGWTLQSQTNIASTNWLDVPASASTNQVVFPINTTNTSMFYRLRYQP